ncbi:MAG: hypothetical protein MJZ30_11430 [Paludibacteraceae bacterium]|nr:hypothetical protein [Paludibacteraceae bacterium]
MKKFIKSIVSFFDPSQKAHLLSAREIDALYYTSQASAYSKQCTRGSYIADLTGNRGYDKDEDARIRYAFF